MTEASSSIAPLQPAPAEPPDPTRRLTRLYIAALGLIATLMVLSQLPIQPALQQQKGYAALINDAGAQRMRSQMIGRAALAMLDADNDATLLRRTAELRDALATWSQVHQALQRGAADSPLPGHDSAAIRIGFDRIEPSYRAMEQAARRLIALAEQSSAATLDAPQERELAASIMEHAPAFLSGMDDIVHHLQLTAQAQVAWLQRTGILLTGGSLLLLLVTARLVFSPAIRALRQQFSRLYESEQRFQLMADHAPVMIWVSGPDRGCTYFNRGWLDFTGRTLEQECGYGWAEGVHPEDLQRCLRIYSQAFEARREFRMEYRLLRHDGHYRWLLDTGTPRLGPDGRFEGYIGSCIDITERKQTERMKTELISVVSHELRTPVTSIVGALGLLAGGVAGALPEPTRRMVAIAQRNGERLARLVNDILDMDRIESGALRFSLQAVDLAALIEEAMENTTPYAQRYKVAMVLEQRLDGVTVRADPDRLSQVLTNLLSNAIKYSPAGAAVSIALTRQEDWVRVSVADRGPGIPEDFRARLFQKFAQADASDARAREGTGLGLSIAKAIVERMGGRIEYQDRAGGGAIFHLDLPPWHTPAGADTTGLPDTTPARGSSILSK